MRFLWRQLGRVLGISAALVGLSVVGSRLLQNDYACLRYVADQAIGSGLLDVNSGARFGVANPATIRGLANEHRASPNGQHIVFIEPLMSNDQLEMLGLNFKVRPSIGTGKRMLARQLPPTYNLRFQWSPDSQSVGYTWMGEDSRRWLAVSALTGEQVLVNTSSNSDPFIHSFSPDSRYVLTIDFYNNRRTLTVWRIDWANKMLTSAFTHSHTFDPSLLVQPNLYTYSVNIDTDLSWSPQSDKLLFTTISGQPDAGAHQVIVASVVTGAQQAYSLVDLPFYDRVYWSPEGQYVAVPRTVVVGSLNWRKVDLYGTERPARIALNGFDSQTDINGITPFWSADSKTFYYLQSPLLKWQRELMAYDISTGQARRLRQFAGGDTVQLYDQRWLCHTTLGNTVQIIDLLGKRPPIFIASSPLGCGVFRRSPDKSLYFLPVVTAAEGGDQMAWEWLQSDTGTMGALPLDNLWQLRWSADGRWVAYSAGIDGNVPNPASIYLLDTLTWQSRRVIDGVVATFYLSPDGKWVFAQRNINNKGTLLIAATDGTRVSEAPFESSWPVLTDRVYWSPDSRLLMFRHSVNRQAVVDVVDTELRLRRRFRDLAFFGTFPAYPPNTIWTQCAAKLPE
jgi:Tol biopolymer transport system component